MHRLKLGDVAPSKGTAHDTRRAFVERARVALTSPVLSDGGQGPAGATGTVAYIWDSGAAC